MIPTDKIEQILQRFEFLEASMAGSLEATEYVSVSKEYAALEPVVLQARAYRALTDDIAAAETMLDDPR